VGIHTAWADAAAAADNLKAGADTHSIVLQLMVAVVGDEEGVGDIDLGQVAGTAQLAGADTDEDIEDVEMLAKMQLLLLLQMGQHLRGYQQQQLLLAVVDTRSHSNCNSQNNRLGQQLWQQ
jgi:hypothetical protein